MLVKAIVLALVSTALAACVGGDTAIYDVASPTGRDAASLIERNAFSMSIMSPIDGESFSPGEQFQLTVEAPGVLPRKMFIAWPNGALEKDNPPWTFDLTLPSDAVGEYMIGAVLIDVRGTSASASVSISTATSVTLTSIAVRPTSITLDADHHQTGIDVWGSFTDGMERFLSGVPRGTSFSSSDTAIAVVSADGIVVVRGVGTATITVENAGQTQVIPVTVSAMPKDSDGDGIPDFKDNCRNTSNPQQEDFNFNGVGDACGDFDRDRIIDASDPCPSIPSESLVDTDEDGVPDDCDNCRDYFNPRVASQQAWMTLTGGQRDDDADGVGNACDAFVTSSIGAPVVQGPVAANLYLAWGLHAWMSREVFESIGQDPNGGLCGKAPQDFRYPCAILDMNQDGAVDMLDYEAMNARIVAIDPAISGQPGFPEALTKDAGNQKCPTCPLLCVGLACDTDRDGWLDSEDTCPTISNDHRADMDGDRVGDACDNCIDVPNPRITTTGFLEGNFTLVDGQRDGEGGGLDGDRILSPPPPSVRGNACDGDFDGMGSTVGPTDVRHMSASIGKDRDGTTCGRQASLTCDMFDLDGVGSTITMDDQAALEDLASASSMPPTCGGACDPANAPYTNFKRAGALTCFGPQCP